MTTSMSAGISRQRGRWLRCFLEIAFVIVLCGGVSASAHEQLDIPGPIHLTHVAGYVANTFGKPVANAEVTLVQNDKVIFKTRTNAKGAFHFDHVSGSFVFRVARTEYAPAAHEIRVGEEIVTYLERKKLYVIVGPGACTDACSSIFTSKHQFDQALRRFNRH